MISIIISTGLYQGKNKSPGLLPILDHIEIDNLNHRIMYACTLVFRLGTFVLKVMMNIMPPRTKVWLFKAILAMVLLQMITSFLAKT